MDVAMIVQELDAKIQRLTATRAALVALLDHTMGVMPKPVRKKGFVNGVHWTQTPKMKRKYTSSKPHWSQTPEGREKLRAGALKRWSKEPLSPEAAEAQRLLRKHEDAGRELLRQIKDS